MFYASRIFQDALNVPHIVRLKRNLYPGALRKYERSPSCSYRAIYIYTREAAAYIRRELGHLYVRGLYKTRSAHIGGVRPTIAVHCGC